MAAESERYVRPREGSSRARTDTNHRTIAKKYTERFSVNSTVLKSALPAD